MMRASGKTVHRWARCGVAALGAVTLALVLTSSAYSDERAGGPVSAADSAAASLSDVRATEGSLIYEPELRPDGQRHINTPRMIEALSRLNVNTYVFPVTPVATNWPDLRTEFLPAARAADIDVWVLIYPPTQPACCSAPYNTNYTRWAEEIAEASAAHSNLTAWTIDDFAYDLRTFTPTQVRRLQSIAKAINPALALVPTVYFPQITSSFATTYGPLVDGVKLPFRDDPDANTSWTWNLAYQVRTASARLTPHGASLFLMPYAHPLSTALQKPTVHYVQTLTGRAMALMREGKIGGIVQYKLPLVVHHASWERPAEDNLARTGNGRLSFVVQADTPTRAGDWCAASQRFAPDPSATAYAVSFWHRDTRGPGGTYTGYHMKQLLVDGKVLWQRDVKADPADVWQRTTVDLTAALAGRSSAKIEWRLYEAKSVGDNWVDASVDDVAATGFTLASPDIESPDTWIAGLARQGTAMYCSAQVYRQHYGEEAGAAIATLYAAS